MQQDRSTSSSRFVTFEASQPPTNAIQHEPSTSGTVVFSLLLFLFWIVLSGKFDGFHLGIGAICSLCVAITSRQLLMLPPAILPYPKHPIAQMPLHRLLTYLPWLWWQIIVASFQVASMVIKPRLDIAPRMVRMRINQPNNLAQLTLATSITLTPGTVTIDVDHEALIVHALSEKHAAALDGPGCSRSMQQRVADLFSPHRIHSI